MRRAIAGAAALAGLLALAAGAFWLRYGGRTVAFPAPGGQPVRPGEALEIVATLEEPPGNVAVAPGGRVFITFHPEARPPVAVAEIVDGKAVPFPGADFGLFVQPFSLRVDRQGRLWTIDTGFHGLRGARLLAFDLATREVVHRWDAPPEIAGKGSYLQDFAVHPDGRHVFIADLSALALRPAIVVYDAATGRARRLLERHASVTARPYRIVAKGREMALLGGLYPFHPALDSIALDRRGEWLYYGPMAHERLFRVRVADLLDDALTPEALAARVEDFGPKPQTDGITTDDRDGIWMTDVERGALWRLGADRRLELVVEDPRVRWPDGFSFGPDGWLYVTDSDIPDVMMRSRGHIRASAPFHLFRFRPGETGAAGH